MNQDPIFNAVLNECNQAYVFRQNLINDIQAITKRKLIVYLASPTHPFAMLTKDDIPIFEELLRTISDSGGVDLMINSQGGDPNTAEKILMMCRQRFKEFNVAVVNYAKSAATMIAIGSDKIYMGYLAELGPIDPQIQIVRPDGKVETIPAGAFIYGLENIRKRIVEEHDPPEMYLPMLGQIRPEIVTICSNALEETKSFAAKWLKDYMMKQNPQWAETVAEMLTKGEKYKSHGKVINFTEAKKVLKLNVELIDNKSELWEKLWELYIRGNQFLQITNQAKLFENEKVSIAMQVGVSQIQRQLPKAGRAPPSQR